MQLHTGITTPFYVKRKKTNHSQAGVSGPGDWLLTCMGPKIPFLMGKLTWKKII